MWLLVYFPSQAQGREGPKMGCGLADVEESENVMVSNFVV